MVAIHSQIHGYINGHQLLDSSIKLERSDQELIDRLSDVAGPLRPGEIFKPYLTGYPLPSGKFYVFARTVQDLDALRAGCVRTKSFIIPLSNWHAGIDPAQLLKLLESTFEESKSIEFDERNLDMLPPVMESGLNELVEVIFLEKRNSVVMFDVLNAELITLRLLTALWPGLRTKFSVCTFALSPRYLLDSSFDLLFSIRPARSRFTDWDGRRIDFSEKKTPERHRWTKQIVESIFYHSPPQLLDSETLTLLGLKDEKSESALRLSLMWNELIEKALDGMPTAILGMLDIVNSRSTINAAWPVLEQHIVRTLEYPSAQTKEMNWKFIEALLLKMGPELISENIEQALNHAGRVFTISSWRSAIIYLIHNASSRTPISLYKTIVETLIESQPDELAEALYDLPIDKLKQVVVIDMDVLEILFEENGKAGPRSRYHNKLLELLSQIPDQEKYNAFKAYLKFIRDDFEIDLLSDILRYAYPYQFIDAANEIWGRNAVRSSLIGEYLCKKSIEIGADTELRNLFATLELDRVTLIQIENLLKESPDINWILSFPNLEGNREQLLNNIILTTSSDGLWKMFGQEKYLANSIELLANSKVEYARSLSKLLPLTQDIKPIHGEIIQSIYPIISKTSEGKDLGIWILSKLSIFKNIRDFKLEKLLSPLLSDLPREALNSALFNSSLSGEQVSENLVLFTSNKSFLSKDLLGNYDRIIDHLINRGRFDLTFNGVRALCTIVSAVEDFAPKAHLTMCGRMLPFAMSGRNGYASELLKVIFPPVYNELANDNDLFDLVRSFVFVDWDKCKTARKELVRAFIHSSWPPVDLLIIAMDCRDPERIINRVLKEHQGGSYLRTIMSSLNKLDEKTIKSVERFLK